MSGFDLRGAKQTPEEYVDQLRDLLEHECFGARKKECLFNIFCCLIYVLHAHY